VPVRDASTSWQGDLMTGSGVVSLDSSDAGQFPVTFPRRAGEPEGQTSPEELVAAAHSACFAMSLANGLSQAGNAPTSLSASAEVTLDRNAAGQLAITKIVISVDGVVPGIDQAAFEEAAATAKAGCIISRALAGVEDITVEATLLEG
jgi:osmotically inducible protein OsmC